MLILLVTVQLLFACSGGSEQTCCDGDVPDAVDQAAPPDAAGDVAVPDTGTELPLDETADAADAPDAGPAYPDHTFVHTMTAGPVVGAKDSYDMDEATQFLPGGSLPSTDVRALSTAGGALWVGAADGLFRKDEGADTFTELPLDEQTGPVLDIAADLTADGVLVVVLADRVELVNEDGDAKGVDSGIELTSVAVSGDAIYLGTKDSDVYEVVFDGFEPVVTPLDMGAAVAFGVRDLAVDGEGTLWIASDMGLIAWDGKSVAVMTKEAGKLADNDVRTVAAAEGGAGVWAGSATGLVRCTAAACEPVPVGVDGLPYDDFRSLAAAGGRLLLGHGIGATAVKGPLAGGKAFERVDHYASGRFIPVNTVTAVALDASGAAWIGTPAGLSVVRWIPHTLAEKAAFMEQLQGDHFWRMDGFVPSDAGTSDPWSDAGWHVWDKDNDGLWTQMQIGAWCYAYAATGDEQYYVKARKAMDVMFLQIDIPAGDFEKAGLGSGFVTRSLVRDDEGSVYQDKTTQPNWHKVEWTDGHTYYWKDDTSSDETTGHFFGYPLFYDLCAQDDAERAEVAKHAAALASYIVDHDFLLIDLDGQKTTHGHWSPDYIGAAAEGLDPCLEKAAQAPDMVAAAAACLESWGGGGWLNGTEILGHLLAAWHMTGDPKFYDAYEDLVVEHHYDNLVMPHAETLTITNPSVMNHSDHELAMLAYHTLIRYEPNPERRQKWIDGLLFLYEWETPERNPLWGAFVALLAGADKVKMDDALRSLREIPFDRRDWLVDTSHRKDALPWPPDRFGDPQWDRIFAYDEIVTVWWNGGFRDLVSGGCGACWSGPMAWLLPYWGFRYAGVIGE
jgi:hypothetical protein